MGEESNGRDDVTDESGKLDLRGNVMNVEELLRMLEAAVEKEFVGMKKTCEGLGGNSDFMQQSKNDETTCSSSAGTPDSMYSATGSIFSTSSNAKEKSGVEICVKTSQDGELPCTSDQVNKAGWTGRLEAFQDRTRTTLEATSANSGTAESSFEVIHDRQVHDASLDSRTSTSEDSTDVNKIGHVSTPEEIIGNFESMTQETMVSEANHFANQTCTESCNSGEVQGDLDRNSTDNPSITSNAAMKDVEGVACSPRDFPVASRKGVGPNTTTMSSIKNEGAFVCDTVDFSDDIVQCDCPDNALQASVKIVEGDVSSVSNEIDSSLTGLVCAENEIEALVYDTKKLSVEFFRKDEPGTAFNASLQRVEGVVFAIRDTSNGFANQAETSLLAIETIQTLDCHSKPKSAVTDEKVGEELSDGNEDRYWKEDTLRDNERLFQSTVQETEESVKPCIFHSKFEENGLLTGGQDLLTGETGQIFLEPCANGWKDREFKGIEEKVLQLTSHTGDGWAFHANLSEVNSSNSYTWAFEELENTSVQLVTSDHETAKPEQHLSAPEALGSWRGAVERLAEATDGSAGRSITAHEYFQEYGWDNAKFMSVSPQILRKRDEHQSEFRSTFEEGSRKNKSLTVEGLTQITDQARVASKRTSEYYSRLHRYGLNDVDMRVAEEPTTAPDHKTTSDTDCGHYQDRNPRSGGHAYTQLANDDVVEHAVGFGSNCCTPSRRPRGLGVHSRPSCSERVLVRDSSQALNSTNPNDSSLSTATFLEMENAASSSVTVVNSEHFAEWDNGGHVRTSCHSCNQSTQSAPSDTFFAQLLRYGRGVKNRRKSRCTPVSRALSESSVLSKLAGEVMEKSVPGTPTTAHFGGCNQREKVKVVVRMRPFAEHEKMSPLKQILCIPEDKVIVKENNPELLKQSCTRSKEFRDAGSLEYRVDNVVDDSYLQKHRWDKKAESQRRMYELIGLPCLEYALDGYNTTIMAYGHAGSGKTYTMMGDDTVEGRGMMPRFAEELMHHMTTEFKNEFVVQVSYLEIYQERIRDLLVPLKVDPQTARAEWQGCPDRGVSRCGSVKSDRTLLDSSDDNVYEESMDGDTASYSSFGAGTPRSWKDRRAPSVCFDNPSTKVEYLKIREHPVSGPYVEGLLWKDVYTWENMERIMLEGAARRTSGVTPNNKDSNRGHTLFTIRIEKGGMSPHVSFVNLVDLAGTEKPKVAKRISLERLEESRYINRSVAHLNDVILNLSKNSKFVSYRSSSLTWLLRDSLGGKFKTFLIAHLSPAEQDFQESVNTLRYAAKANHIQSTMISHPEKKKQLFVNMKKEVKFLHHLIRDLTRKEEDARREEEFLHLGSCFPVLSSFKVPRVDTSLNSENFNWI